MLWFTYYWNSFHLNTLCFYLFLFLLCILYFFISHCDYECLSDCSWKDKTKTEGLRGGICFVSRLCAIPGHSLLICQAGKHGEPEHRQCEVFQSTHLMWTKQWGKTAMGIIRHYGAFIRALCRFIMDAWFWLEASNRGCTVWCWEQLHPTLLMRFIINLISQNQNAAKPSLRFGIDWTDSTLCLTDAACIKKRPHH